MKNILSSILIIIPILFVGCVNMKNSGAEEIVGQYHTKNKSGITSTLELNQDSTFIYRNRIDSFIWETSGVWGLNSRVIKLKSTNSIQKDSSYFVVNKGERNRDTITIILNKGGHYSTNFYINDKMVRSAGSDNVLIFPKFWGDSVVINELWSSNSIRLSLSYFEFDTLYVNTFKGEEFIKEFKDEKFNYRKGRIKLGREIWLSKEF